MVNPFYREQVLNNPKYMGVEEIMKGNITIKKAELVDVMWGICLSDNHGDVWDSVEPLIKALGISKNMYGDELLDKMKEMDLIPDYQRD